MLRADLASDPVVTVFGRVSIATASGQHVPGDAGARLLAMLAVSHPDPVPQDVVAEAVYPAVDPDRARRALRTTVWRLRQATRAGLIVTDRGSYRLGVGRTELDLTRFEDLAVAARTALLSNQLEQAEERARLAVASWVGDPFPGLRDVPGVDDRSAAATVMRGGTIEDWADATIRLGRPRIALDHLVALSAAEPLRERAWTLRLEAFRALDQWDDVARTRTLATEALAEVGIEPGSDLRGALDRASRTPTVSSLPRRLDRSPDVGVPAWMRVASDHGAFIGRDHERKILLDVVDEAARGKTMVVVIRGEPGAGKTRLASEVATALAERSVRVLGGRCDQYGLIPFAPFVAPLRRLVETADPVEAGRLTSGPLGRLLSPGSSEAEGHDDATTEQQALFAAVVDLFRLAAGDETTLLVIDDLQWASSATVLLLRHLVLAAPDLRLCLMVTTREQPASRHADMDPASLLATLPSASVVPLGALSISDIAAHPDLAPEPDPNATARSLMRQTGGNPLLLTTVLRSRDGPSGDDQVQPLIVEAAIEAHLERFGPDDREVLGLGAAAGPDVDPILLRVAGPKLGFAPSAVNHALDSAETAGVVDLADAGWYAFRHDLLREALLDGLPGSRRAEFHAALADAIETLHDASTGPALFELAGHLHRARSVVQPERIQDATTRAARAAAADLDFDAAAQLYERAADASGRARSRHQAALLLDSAQCRRCAGDADAAEALIDSAIIAAAGQPDVLSQAVVERGRHELMVTGTIADATVEMAGSVLGRIPAADTGREAELWYLRVIGDHRRGQLSEALAVIDDPEIVFESGVRAFRDAGPEDRVGLAQLIGEVASALGGVRPQVYALMVSWLVDIERGTGHVDDPVAGELDRLVDSGDSDVYLRWVRDSWKATRDLAAGRMTRARWSVDAAHARARGATLPMDDLARIHAAHRGQVSVFSLLTGPSPDYDLLVHPLNRYATAAPITWEATVTVGMLWAGGYDGAASRFARVCDEALDPERVIADRLYSLCLLASGCEALGDTTTAARIRDALLPYRGHVAVAGHFQVLGSVDHWLAIAHRTLGELDLAVETVAAARDQARRQGMDTWHAMSTMDLVRTLTMRDEAGDRAEAVRLADDVVPWADAAGMQTVVAGLTMMTEPFRR